MSTAILDVIGRPIGEISELLNKGANINERDDAGVTPLLYAVGLGRYDLVEFLVENGADPSLPDNSGLTPVEFAGQRNDRDMLRALKLI